MSVAIIVPARLGSTRYPGKPLAPLTGASGIAKPLIQRSWEAACAVPGVDSVVVATDDDQIAEVAMAFGADVIMTSSGCINGTARCAAALKALDRHADVVVNLQGDAPLTPPGAVTALIDAMSSSAVQVATPVVRASPAVQRRLLQDQRDGRVGGTTVVANAAGNALYFSKSVIPHLPADRIGDATLPLFLHLGVYAYGRETLARYPGLPASILEELEGLEQLRFLAAGIPVKLVEIELDGDDMWELNNPTDIAPIEAALQARGIV